MMNCSLCERIKLASEGKYPYVIHEFENSFLMLGEHQFFPGYCVLITKDHHKEMTDIPSPQREKVFQELMLASKAVELAMNPDKMNMCSLGNVVPHVHWHLFPRYKSDEKFFEPPWLRMELFDTVKISPSDGKVTLEKIRQKLLVLP